MKTILLADAEHHRKSEYETRLRRHRAATGEWANRGR